MSVYDADGTIYDVNNIEETAYTLMNAGIPVMPFIYVGNTAKFCYTPPSLISNPYTANIANVSGNSYVDSNINSEMWAAVANVPLITKAFIPPGTKITYSASACGNVEVISVEDPTKNVRAYSGLCYRNGAAYVGSSLLGFGEAAQCIQPKAHMPDPVACPIALTLTGNNVGEMVDLSSNATHVLNAGGITMPDNRMYLGKIILYEDLPALFSCGTCAGGPEGINLLDPALPNVGIIDSMYADYHFPDGIDTFQDYLLQYSCMEQEESARIQVAGRGLSKYQPGTETCDNLVSVFCSDAQNAEDVRCVCFQEEAKYLATFGDTPIPFPVQCLGQCATNPKAYRKGTWEDQGCNVQICADLVNLNGNSIVNAGVSEIVCDGNSYIVDPDVTPHDTYVTLTPITGMSDTTEYILISIGAIYLLIFVIWAALYIRMKLSS